MVLSLGSVANLSFGMRGGGGLKMPPPPPPPIHATAYDTDDLSMHSSMSYCNNWTFLTEFTDHWPLTFGFRRDTNLVQFHINKLFTHGSYRRRWGDKTMFLKNVKCSGEPKNMAALTLWWMGHPSFYHATVALSFQIEICNMDRTKSSFLATS